MSLLRARLPSASPALGRVARQIKEISTLPQVALRLTGVADDPHSEAADIKQAMESDAALSARVLRHVNSSAHALRGKITNLEDAIIYLGTNSIRNLALTSSVSELFRENATIGPYRRSELWRHMVSVGICSRMIAKRLGLADFEDMFLAGLLHDIGIVLEDQYLHDDFSQVVCSLQEDRTLAEIERSHLGFDHAALGAQVGQLWGFPEAVTAAVRYHHMSVNYRGDHIDTVRCVEVANLICTLKGITSVGLALVKYSGPAVAGLSLTRDDLARLMEDLDQELRSNAAMLRI